MPLRHPTGMQQGKFPLEISASSIFPGRIGKVIRPLEPTLMRLLIPRKLIRSVPDSEISGTTASCFADHILDNLDIRYSIPDTDLNRIPSSGAALLVSNHPFGFLEGLIFFSVLERVRPDYRILANGLLASVREIREKLILINPFQEVASRQQNCASLRESLDWLNSGGLLVVFPAGEVAHLTWQERPVADPKWNSTAARLARKAGCPALPVFFDGANSLTFQMMGTIHPRFRTLSLPRELTNKSRHTIRIRVGAAIPDSVLKSYADADLAIEYLRARTYLLCTRANASQRHHVNLPFAPKPKPIAAAIGQSVLQSEIAALEPSAVLAENADFLVLLADPSRIPNVVREIGRCRELTYRQVGEGTGAARDVDEFDCHYHHLFLWSKRNGEIAGAYRIAATPDVLGCRGVSGLYTSTLFQYDPEFFARIGPAFELGRSFVLSKYQKDYAPLLLLWKGIARSVERRPECAVLFGAVSVSSNYQVLSRNLITEFFGCRQKTDLSSLVTPRHRFRAPLSAPKHLFRLSRLLPTLDELSSAIQDVEHDGKGLPVLIRQYLKIGGQVLGFNVDTKFSNALDVLVLADLRTAPTPMLERCMGKAAAITFRNWHEVRYQPTA